MVPQRNFVLVVQPGLVVVPPARVANPLSEALAHSREIAGHWLSVRSGKVREKMRICPDESVPQIQDVIDLIVQDFASLTQSLVVLIGKQHRLLQQVEVPRERVASELGRLTRRCIR